MWSMLEPILSWVCMGSVIVVLGWSIYAGIIKPVTHPNPTTTQTGGISYTVNVSPFSCARIPSPTEQIPTAAKPVVDKIIKK